MGADGCCRAPCSRSGPRRWICPAAVRPSDRFSSCSPLGAVEVARPRRHLWPPRRGPPAWPVRGLLSVGKAGPRHGAIPAPGAEVTAQRQITLFTLSTAFAVSVPQPCAPRACFCRLDYWTAASVLVTEKHGSVGEKPPPPSTPGTPETGGGGAACVSSGPWHRSQR